MKWFLYTISFLWIILGVIQVLYTEKTTIVFKKLMVDRNPKVLAIAPFLIGILLCISALLSLKLSPRWFVFSLGLLGCLKGTLFFLLPVHQTKKFVGWWFDKVSDRFVRLGGLILYTLGLVILSWI